MTAAPRNLDVGVRERPLTVRDVIALSQAGAFGEGERVDLIDGRLYVAPADGPLHMQGTSGVGSALSALLLADSALAGTWRLIPNASIAASETRLLCPDFAVVRRGVVEAGKLPTADDVALAVEVADTSLAYDEGEKKQRYAEAGLRELWIVRMGFRDLHVSRAPAQGAWAFEQLYGVDEAVRPLFAPGADVAVKALLGEA